MHARLCWGLRFLQRTGRYGRCPAANTGRTLRRACPPTDPPRRLEGAPAVSLHLPRPNSSQASQRSSTPPLLPGAFCSPLGGRGGGSPGSSLSPAPLRRLRAEAHLRSARALRRAADSGCSPRATVASAGGGPGRRGESSAHHLRRPQRLCLPVCRPPRRTQTGPQERASERRGDPLPAVLGDSSRQASRSSGGKNPAAARCSRALRLPELARSASPLSSHPAQPGRVSRRLFLPRPETPLSLRVKDVLCWNVIACLPDSVWWARTLSLSRVPASMCRAPSP